MITIEDTQCCAVSEIDGLAGFIDPAEAMLAICKAMGFYAYKSAFNPTRKPDIDAFYIFTGVEDCDEVECTCDADFLQYNACECDAIDNDIETGYGRELAKFIKKNKLGDVVESPLEYNRVNHPTHLVGVWVWRPDVKKLTEWFYKNK
jgi:hypothetical protein